MDKLEEIRQSVSNVWGKQPCWPTEKDCVLHVVAPYLLRRLEAAEAALDAALACVDPLTLRAQRDLDKATMAWEQAKAEHDGTDN